MSRPCLILFQQESVCYENLSGSLFLKLSLSAPYPKVWGLIYFLSLHATFTEKISR